MSGTKTKLKNSGHREIKMDKKSEVGDLWNKWGEQDAAIESWKHATPEQLELRLIYQKIVDDEIDKQIIEQLKQFKKNKTDDTK
jgi:hypothetical protein